MTDEWPPIPTTGSDYQVTERNGWSYVLGPTVPEHSGPWRYGWEAQEYADELNRLKRHVVGCKTRFTKDENDCDLCGRTP